MNKEVIFTEKAPKAIGPYSQAQKVGDLLFTSGQIPLNPSTGELVTEIKAATKQSLEYKSYFRGCWNFIRKCGKNSSIY